jgi:hypothetical protein
MTKSSAAAAPTSSNLYWKPEQAGWFALAGCDFSDAARGSVGHRDGGRGEDGIAHRWLSGVCWVEQTEN